MGRVGKWLSRTRYFVAAALVPLGMLALVSLVFGGEPAVRLTGMALQLAGFAVVFFSLHDVLSAFGLKHPVQVIFGWIDVWWRDRPWHRRNIIVEASGVSASTSFGSARVSISLPPDSPVERRLDHLEMRLTQLTAELDQLSTHQRQHQEKTQAALQSERAERQAADTVLSQQVRAALVDGLGLDLLGLWLFCLGILLGTASPEIYALLGAVGVR